MKLYLSIASLTAICHARLAFMNTLPAEERGVHYSKPSEVPISKGGEVEDEALTSKGRQ